MAETTFLAATGRGLVRASRNGDRWSVENLLPGTNVRCLVSDPLNPRIVHAGTRGRGVLRSDDGGRAWRPAGLDRKIVTSLAVSRADPNTLYAGTKPALLHASRDGGATWTELESFRRIRSRWFWFSPADPPGYSAYVQALTVSPADPNLILAGIELGAVVRSTDGGRSWSGHRPGAMRDCHSLTFHVSDGRWAYQGGAGFRARGAAISRNAGETWSAPKEGLDRGYGWAVAADPARPEIWYVSVSPSPWKAHVPGRAEAYIFRSVGGASWDRLGGGLPQPLDHMPFALVTDRAAPGHLYAGLGNGDIWFSADYGDRWEQLPIHLDALRTLVLL